jgi:uncharacterized protein involved in oxidation of intracellular sulfur
MVEGVEIEELTHKKFNVSEKVKTFQDTEGEILACGTCLRSRNMDETEVCPISTMIDCV